MNAKRLLRGFSLSCLLGVALAGNAFAAPVKLPAGPDGSGRFGAYQTWLQFTPEWDAQWRMGSRNDVVVRFDTTPARLVFWHGANYVPCWVNDSGSWYSYGAVLRPDAGPFNDRLCRFAYAIVVESTDARAVVRWRYAPTDVKGELINADPVTRWNDWVDEMYTIYPDATGVRKITLHSSEWKQPCWIQQSIRIRQPGETTSGSESVKTGGLATGTLCWINLKGSKPFLAIASSFSNAPNASAWGEWPVRGASERPSHRVLSGIQWKPVSEELNSKTWRMLIGLGNGNESLMKAIAQGWMMPPGLKVDGQGPSTGAFLPDEKAYVIQAQPGSTLRLTLTASASSPLVNPAFVIQNWGRSDISVAVNGKRVPRGSDLRYGYRKTTTGADLVLWTRLDAAKTTTLEISAANNRGE